MSIIQIKSDKKTLSKTLQEVFEGCEKIKDFYEQKNFLEKKNKKVMSVSHNTFY